MKSIYIAVLLFFASSTALMAKNDLSKESELAKRALAANNSAAKVGLRETEAAVVQKNGDIALVVYRDAFTDKGELSIDGIQATVLHSFSSDFNYALVIDRNKQLPQQTDSTLSHFLQQSKYRSYHLGILRENDKEAIQLPLAIPDKGDITLMIFSSYFESEIGKGYAFPELFKLTRCQTELSPVRADQNSKTYRFKQDDNCPVLYQLGKRIGNKDSYRFFAMANSSEDIIKKQIARCRDIMAQNRRLIAAEQKKKKVDSSKIKDYEKKIKDQETEIKRLARLLRGISE